MANSFSKIDKRGFTLIELMTTVAVMGVVLSIISTVFLGLLREQKRANFLTALSELRLTLQQPVIRTQDWVYTRSQNAGMACFNGYSSSSCLALRAMTPQDLKLYSGGALIYDSSNATAGYTLDGLPCTTYGSSKDCVLKPVLTWQAQCNLAIDPACLSPHIVVNLGYNYDGPSLGQLNFPSYGYRIGIASFPIKAAEACVGTAPTCSSNQAAVCESSVWTCEEFGL